MFQGNFLLPSDQQGYLGGLWGFGGLVSEIWKVKNGKICRYCNIKALFEISLSYTSSLSPQSPPSLPVWFIS
jgi:hypothetical protein